VENASDADGEDSVLASQFTLIRIFRLLRLSRTLRLVARVQYVHTLVKGLYAAVKTVAYVFSLVLLLLFTFGCIAAETIGKSAAFTYLDTDPALGSIYLPKNDTVSQVAHAKFGSVIQGMLTTFQLATYDNWFNFVVLPIVSENPSTAAFFVPL